MNRHELLFRLRNLPHRLRGLKAELLTLLGWGVNTELSAKLFRADGSVIDLGVLSRRVVTTVGIGFVVDAFQNLAELENMNWHDAGTGTTAEAAGDTGLQIPWGGARVSGAQTKPASNQYRTTATISFNNTFAITEHGVFSANAAGTLLDRSVFAAINVVNGDSIQFQYTLTVSGS